MTGIAKHRWRETGDMQDKSDPNDGGQNPANDELSEDALVALLAGGNQEFAEEEETEDAEEEESEDEDEQADEADEAEDEEEDEPENEGINLDDLTDEDWEVVRKKLGSRAAKDIPKLKRENQQLRQANEQLQAQQQTSSTAEPEPVESPLFKGVETTEQLQAKATELRKQAKFIEALLDDNDGLSADEEIEHGGNSYTKRQWKQALRNTRDALDEALPYLQHKFQQRDKWKQEGEQWTAAAQQQFPELSDESSEFSKLHSRMMGDPKIEKIRKASPELIPQLGFLLAHACRSIAGGAKPKKAEKPTTTGTKVKVKAPANPSGVAATPLKAVNHKAKEAQVKSKRFSETGDPEDLVAALAARESNR